MPFHSSQQSMNTTLMDSLSMGFNEILRSFVSSNISNKEMKFYTGKVVSNNDPDQEGKCQIRVYGLFADVIPDEDLPWAIPDFNFIGGTAGSFIVPPVGAMVRVYFDNGDVYAPMYTTKAFNKEDMKKFTSISDTANSDYPNTMVFFETDQGEYFKINRKTLQTTYKHSSGVLVNIDKDGNISINTEAATGDGSITISTKGDVTVNAGGDANVIAEGDANIDAVGNVKLGNNAAKQLLSEQLCFVTGAPHFPLVKNVMV